MTEWGYLRYRKDMGPFEQVGDENPNIDLLVSTSWMERVTIDYEAAEQEHRRQLRMGPHVTHRIVDAALGSNEECGAWGGCVLPRGHNMGKADIPSNHAAVGEDKT